MIKGNESDVRNIDFELQAKRDDKFCSFTLFLKLKNCSYLWNQMSDWDGIWIKMYHFKWASDLYWKKQNWKLPTCDSFSLIMSHIGASVIVSCVWTFCHNYDNVLFVVFAWRIFFFQERLSTILIRINLATLYKLACELPKLWKYPLLLMISGSAWKTPLFSVISQIFCLWKRHFLLLKNKKYPCSVQIFSSFFPLIYADFSDFLYLSNF